jgi:hypothetical protein
MSVNGKAQNVTDLYITPANPTNSDIITLTSDVLFGSGNCNLDYSSIEIEGNQITIIADYMLGFASVMCEVSDEFEIGNLEAGDYEVNYLLTTNFSSPDTITETIYFTVQNSSENNWINLTIIPENPTEADSIFLISNLLVSVHDLQMFNPDHMSYELHEQDNIITLIYSYVGAAGAGVFYNHNYIDTLFLGSLNSGSYTLNYQFQSLILEDDFFIFTDIFPFNVEESTDNPCETTFTEQNIPLVLNQGWNMIGYNCIEPMNAEDAFAEISDKITIVKDNLGNAYLPNLGFNGLGDLEFSQGYQIKLTEDIDDFFFCPTIVLVD